MAEWMKQEYQAAMAQVEEYDDMAGFLDYSEPEVVDVVIGFVCQLNRALAHSKAAQECLACEDVDGAFKHLNAAIAVCD